VKTFDVSNLSLNRSCDVALIILVTFLQLFISCQKGYANYKNYGVLKLSAVWSYAVASYWFCSAPFIIVLTAVCLFDSYIFRGLKVTYDLS